MTLYRKPMCDWMEPRISFFLLTVHLGKGEKRPKEDQRRHKRMRKLV